MADLSLAVVRVRWMGHSCVVRLGGYLGLFFSTY